ncbi:MAG: sulfite exporter TauE/SafE family protein [Alphaproteobacteria bacterium]|nr:sulfite exporter TauE/SafE family protein [Alphaproteobacteria bacterium]
MVGIDPLALALAALVAFVSAIIAGVSGFGVGLVLPPFLAAVVGVEAVVPTMAVGMAITNGSRLWAYRRAVHWPAWSALMVAVLPLAIASAFVYTRLEHDAVAIVLGVFLIAMVPLRRVLARREFEPGWRTWLGIGGVYGGLSGVTTGVGALLIAGLMAAGLAGAPLVATDAAVSTVVNLVRLVVYSAHGLVGTREILVGMVVGGATVPAAFLARSLMARLPISAHVWIMEVLVILGGVSFLWRAIAD